ncbi:MAG: hypothetical protein JSV04_01910, partial [Candidatus Heimdallarchaeota archaeon]
MNTVNLKQLKFYDGRTHFIDKKRMTEFETKSLTERFFSGQNVDAATVIEELGPVSLHFSNVQPWAEEIPDIDSKSARLFTIWGEDTETKEIVVIIRGFFVLPPFQWGKETIQDYYFFGEDIPYFPMAVISSFQTIFKEDLQLIELLEQLKEEIQKNWQDIRNRMIDTLEKTDLW